MSKGDEAKVKVVESGSTRNTNECENQKVISQCLQNEVSNLKSIFFQTSCITIVQGIIAHLQVTKNAFMVDYKLIISKGQTVYYKKVKIVQSGSTKNQSKCENKIYE